MVLSLSRRIKLKHESTTHSLSHESHVIEARFTRSLDMNCDANIDEGKQR